MVLGGEVSGNSDPAAKKKKKVGGGEGVQIGADKTGPSQSIKHRPPHHPAKHRPVTGGLWPPLLTYAPSHSPVLCYQEIKSPLGSRPLI